MARYFTHLGLVKYLAISHADSCNKSYACSGVCVMRNTTLQVATRELQSELVDHIVADECVSPLVQCVVDFVWIMTEVELLLR